MSDVVLSVPVDAGGVDPLLASLEKINENLNQINTASKGSFELMAKSLDKTNKKLKETDKHFGEIFKKIKLSGLMKMGAGVIGAGAGLVGLSAGALLFGALKNSAGTIGTRYGGAGLGMSPAEMKALQTASKLTTGKEETLINAMTNLSNALTSGSGAGALANLGLSQESLKAMSPEKALEAVFNAVKGKGTGIGFEYLRNAFSEITGLSGQDYNVATKQGAGFSKDYNEFLAKYAGVDFGDLGRGAEAMIRFQTQMDIVSQKIGSKLADPLSAVLDKLTPWLDKFGTWIASLLGSITQEDVDRFMQNVQKVFGIVANVAGDVTAGATGKESAYAGTAQFAGAFLGNIGKNIGFALDPESRARQLLAQKEPFLRDMLKEKNRQFTSEQWSWLQELGYIKNGQLTDKAREMNVTITVKDPAGNVLSSSVVTQGAPKAGNPMKGGAR